MRMGNPSVRRWASKSGSVPLNPEVTPVTYKGVYGKTAILALLTIVAAVATEFLILNAIANANWEFIVTASIAASVSFIPMLIMALVIAFVPSSAKYLAPVYSVLQGALLGSVALFVDMVYPGIAFAAFLGTAIVFIVCVLVNRFLEVKINNRFMRGMLIAFFSLIVVELIMYVLSLFGVFSFSDTTFIVIQIVISFVCIAWATIMMMWDLQSIDVCVQNGMDKKLEWNLAFSLVTTLVYLYIEILELLLRFLALFNRNKK